MGIVSPCKCGACRELPERKCPSCGVRNFHTSYSGAESDRMRATGECFECAFWELRLSKPAPDRLVIDGWTYGVGREPSDAERRRPGVMLGMSGRRFDVELADGRRFTTHNLWSGGQIPERYRSRLPDNAAFVGGSREKVDDITCWNPADPRADRYPTFHELKG